MALILLPLIGRKLFCRTFQQTPYKSLTRTMSSLCIQINHWQRKWNYKDSYRPTVTPWGSKEANLFPACCYLVNGGKTSKTKQKQFDR